MKNLRSISVKGVALSLSFASMLSASEHRALAYWVFGQENPDTVVLIHGFNSSHATWDEVAHNLSKDYRVVVYDQPGHGESSAEGKDFSPAFLAGELKDLLDGLGISKAHIVGHSMGGRTAIEFAARYPGRVQSLVVEDMGIESVPASVSALPLNLEKFERVREGVPEIFGSKKAAVAILTQFYTIEETMWILGAAEIQSDGTVKLGNRPEVTALYLHAGLAMDMSERLKLIEAPILFFAADPDHWSAVLKGEAARAVKRARPDVPIQVFSGSSHRIHERPDFMQKLREFLDASSRD